MLTIHSQRMKRQQSAQTILSACHWLSWHISKHTVHQTTARICGSENPSISFCNIIWIHCQRHKCHSLFWDTCKLYAAYDYREGKKAKRFTIFYFSTSLLSAFLSFSLLCNVRMATVCLDSPVSLWLNMLHTTFIFPKKVWGDVEPGDWKRLVIALPAFLCLAPVGLETIYTAAEEAPHSLVGRYTSWDFMSSDYTNA